MISDWRKPFLLSRLRSGVCVLFLLLLSACAIVVEHSSHGRIEDSAAWKYSTEITPDHLGGIYPSSEMRISLIKDDLIVSILPLTGIKGAGILYLGVPFPIGGTNPPPTEDYLVIKILFQPLKTSFVLNPGSINLYMSDNKTITPFAVAASEVENCLRHDWHADRKLSGFIDGPSIYGEAIRIEGNQQRFVIHENVCLSLIFKIDPSVIGHVFDFEISDLSNNGIIVKIPRIAFKEGSSINTYIINK